MLLHVFIYCYLKILKCSFSYYIVLHFFLLWMSFNATAHIYLLLCGPILLFKRSILMGRYLPPICIYFYKRLATLMGFKLNGDGRIRGKIMCWW